MGRAESETHRGFRLPNRIIPRGWRRDDWPFTPSPLGGGLAFIYDSWGTYIELNERPNPL
jgi:hypothetical protein